MRAAKAKDNWRGVYKKQYPFSIDQLLYENITSVGSGRIEFRGGITALCGSNGVGKTTLLQALLSTVKKTPPPTSYTSRLRVGNYNLIARLTLNASTIEIIYPSDTTEEPQRDDLPIFWLDSAARSATLLSRLISMTNFDELLEPLSPREATEEELKLLSYIVGRNYEACEIYEIEDLADEEPFPYFKVKCDGVEYGSEAMGLGELSLYLIFWYLNQTPKQSILLLEEPETHISPRSQIHLLNVIAKLSLERSIWVILSTHSPGILTNVPQDHIRLLSRQAGSVQVIANPDFEQLHTVLGVTPNYSGVLLVEDQAAQEFLKYLLSFFDKLLLQSFDIVIAGSDGHITAALKAFPRASSRLKIIGVYDGDIRSIKQPEVRRNVQVPPEQKPTYDSSYIFLPGDKSPEELLRPIANVSVNQLADASQSTAQNVSFILGEIEGFDHHDWFTELHMRLHIRYEVLMSQLIFSWLQTEQNKDAAEQTYKNLLEKIQE